MLATKAAGGCAHESVFNLASHPADPRLSANPIALAGALLPFSAQLLNLRN